MCFSSHQRSFRRLFHHFWSNFQSGRFIKWPPYHVFYKPLQKKKQQKYSKELPIIRSSKIPKWFFQQWMPMKVRGKKYLSVTTLCVELSREGRAFRVRFRLSNQTFNCCLHFKKTRKLSDIAISIHCHVLVFIPWSVYRPLQRQIFLGDPNSDPASILRTPRPHG